MFWMDVSVNSLSLSCPFCISSPPGNPITSLAFLLDSANNRLQVSCMVDGVTMWQMHTASGVLEPLVGSWANASIVHNGVRPSLYINFSNPGTVFDVHLDKTAWLPDLMSAVVPVTTMYVGGQPRPFSPYIALGFTGGIDELQWWEGALSVEEMRTAYGLDSSSSSSSSSST